MATLFIACCGVPGARDGLPRERFMPGLWMLMGGLVGSKFCCVVERCTAKISASFSLDFLRGGALVRGLSAAS